MCFDVNATPPAPPRAVPVASTENTEVTSADGTRFTATLALPEAGAGVGVVVLPDVRGLHPYYVALTEALATAGLPALALDYFGRTAGTGVRDGEFEFAPHVQQVQPGQLDVDVSAAIAVLRERTGDHDLPVVTLGFCFGGGHSWRLAGRTGVDRPDLAGVIGFYGRPETADATAGTAQGPVLMLVAGADAHIPPQASAELAEEMSAAGADVSRVVFDGAPHSFFDRTAGDHAAACEQAWREILAFTDSVAACPGASAGDLDSPA